MAEITNPDDILLKKKDPEPNPLFPPPPKVTQDLFEPKKNPIEKICDWWNSLPIKPFVKIVDKRNSPDGKNGAIIGIQGTF